MSEMKPNSGESRASFILRVAAAYIREHWPEGIAFYDGTNCDGYCVADDCETSAEMLGEAPAGEVMGSEPAVAAIQYALETDEGLGGEGRLFPIRTWVEPIKRAEVSDGLFMRRWEVERMASLRLHRSWRMSHWLP